jgi:hypothetical protein
MGPAAETRCRRVTPIGLSFVDGPRVAIDRVATPERPSMSTVSWTLACPAYRGSVSLRAVEL